MRWWGGAANTLDGVPTSRILPPSMKTMVPATSRAKPISLGHDHHCRAGGGEFLDDVQHLADQLGIERRSRLVEERHLRLQGECPGNGDTLLLAAGEVARTGIGLLRQADAGV